jgi:hypothetical protein
MTGRHKRTSTEDAEVETFLAVSAATARAEDRRGVPARPERADRLPRSQAVDRDPRGARALRVRAACARARSDHDRAPHGRSQIVLPTPDADRGSDGEPGGGRRPSASRAPPAAHAFARRGGTARRGREWRHGPGISADRALVELLYGAGPPRERGGSGSSEPASTSRSGSSARSARAARSGSSRWGEAPPTRSGAT